MQSNTHAIRTRLLNVGSLAFTSLEAGEGPLVLMLHGFPDEPATFEAQLTALARAGYHVVALTLRGYEASSRPADGVYRLVDLVGDVTGWLNALAAEEAHLVGHDWGATIAYAASVAAPDRIRSLTMIAVPPLKDLFLAMRRNPRQTWRSKYMFFFQFGELSDWWMRRNRAAALLLLSRSWSLGWVSPAGCVESLRCRFSDPAVLRAALDYYRQVLDTKTSKGRASAALIAGTVRAPVLGLCGRNDTCIGADVFATAMSPAAFPHGVMCRMITGAGHFVHAERPEVVNDHLRDWLTRN